MNLHRPSFSTRRTGLALLALSILSLPLVAGTAFPGEPVPDPGDAAAAPAAAAVPSLPPRYQELIREEMRQIEGAMQELLPALVRGEAEAGARLARGIEQSFVMRRQLAEEERHELHRLLPEEFLHLDHGFHLEAGALAEHLEGGDFAAAAASYAGMTRSCVACHTRFAGHRFPAFQDPPAGSDAGGSGR